MEYEKQTFVNGQILSAELLNRMELGIQNACNAAPPECLDADCSKVLSHGANGCEWVDRRDATLESDLKKYADEKVEKLFSSGNTVLSEFQYGDDLPAAGTVGRIFFKRVQT